MHKHFFLGVATGLTALFFFALAIFVVQHYESSQKPLNPPELETDKNMSRKLPKEFTKQVALASPSAVRVPILMYHYVENIVNKNDKLRVELNVPPNIFSLQVQTLQNAGYTFMTAKELGEVLDGKMSLPKKPILLTFDDGHWDLATDVLPILEQYHVKATAYIIPGFIGGSDFLSESQLKTVAQSGLIEIGAHTVHHISLKGQPYTLVKNEIDESKVLLQNELHIPVVSFAYPYGTFDLQAVQLVQADGFSTAVSTVPGIEQGQVNRFFLYRLRPGYRTGQYLLTWLAQNQFTAF